MSRDHASGCPAAADAAFRDDVEFASRLGRQEPDALAEFARTYVPWIASILRNKGLAPSTVDDLLQDLSVRLFVRKPPAIFSYVGKGPLKAWLAIVASRAVKEYATHDSSTPVGLERLASADAPLSKRLLRSLHARPFREAFARAIATLEPKQRTILRLSFVDGLSIDQIGPILGVHRATAARWIERARAELRLQTRIELARDLRVDRRDVDSILRDVGSELDASVERLLACQRTSERSIDPTC